MQLEEFWDKIIEFVEKSLAICSTAIVFMLGEVNEAMQAFIVLMILDYLTGIRKAWKTSSLSSKIGSKGIEKKVRIIVVIAVAHMVDKILGVPDSTKLSLKFTMILAYSCNEALSIIENLKAVGTWVPPLFKDKLEQVKEGLTTKKKEPKEKELDFRPNIFSSEYLPKVDLDKLDEKEGETDGKDRKDEN